MTWKKLLESSEIIAYEKVDSKMVARIEARNKNNLWLVYKTYTKKNSDPSRSQVSEYLAKTFEETQQLIEDLKRDDDLPVHKSSSSLKKPEIKLKRIFKEDFLEKWQVEIDNFNEDNYIIIRYDSEIKFDLILHERYNPFEKELITSIIDSLGLKDLTDKIRYDIFYYRKHTAKRRVYRKEPKGVIYAKLSFGVEEDNKDDFNI
jgi:hypothetical protein